MTGANSFAADQERQRPNVLLITADDMNCDSVGAFGCVVPGTTPNIDTLAGEGMRFEHGHVTIAVCQPCRSVLMTGRYPHRSGGEAFHRLRIEGVPILPDELRAGGYRVGILGKVGHSTPYAAFEWDMVHDQPELGGGRNPEAYGKFAKGFFDAAGAAGKPFFLMANSHDPHRPFHGNDAGRGWRKLTPPAVAPSRVFKPDEVTVPGFLADLPEVRREIAEYYSSVRRCDDTVGKLLAALKQSGQADNTLVIYLSDHGMSLPFAKTNCYLHSTRTPLIVRWPGRVAKGSVDRDHFVAGIDVMPTVLDAAGLPQPGGMDGSSALPVLAGRKQIGRDRVFTQFHATSSRRQFPMRCVQNKRFGYIFNPWSDGKLAFRNESQAGRTWKAMAAAAPNNPKIAARVKLFSHRVLEEFYDLAADPDALVNLIDDRRYAAEIDKLRADLLAYMRRTADPALDALVHRDDPAVREKLMRALSEKLPSRKRKPKNK